MVRRARRRDAAVLAPSFGFVADFRRFVVVPHLVPAIQWWAATCAGGWVSFSEAVGEVMATAMAYGAGYLEPEPFAELEDWVIEQMAEVVAAEMGP